MAAVESGNYVQVIENFIQYKFKIKTIITLTFFDFTVRIITQKRLEFFYDGNKIICRRSGAQRRRALEKRNSTKPTRFNSKATSILLPKRIKCPKT